MKLLTVGLRGPTGYLRADSEPLDDAEAAAQFAEVTQRITDQGMVQLPWLVVRASDVLLVRLTRLQ
jgi:hypothetical protein